MGPAGVVDEDRRRETAEVVPYRGCAGFDGAARGYVAAVVSDAAWG